MNWISKNFSVLAAIISGLWVAASYLDTREREIFSENLKTKRVYLEFKQETYRSLVLATSRLAAICPEIEEEISLIFERDFVGLSSLIESYEVEKGLVTFYKSLKKRDCIEMKAAAHIVAIRAREDLAKSWEIEDWRRPEGWEEHEQSKLQLLLSAFKSD